MIRFYQEAEVLDNVDLDYRVKRVFNDELVKI